MMDVQKQRLYKKSMWNGIIAILALLCMDDLQFYSGWKTLLQFFQDEGQNKGSGDERCILSTEKCRMISLLMFGNLVCCCQKHIAIRCLVSISYR